MLDEKVKTNLGKSSVYRGRQQGQQKQGASSSSSSSKRYWFSMGFVSSSSVLLTGFPSGEGDISLFRFIFRLIKAQKLEDRDSFKGKLRKILPQFYPK